MATIKISQYATLDSERRCDAEHITAPIYVKDNYYNGAEVSALTQYGTSKQLNEHQKGFPVLRLNEFEQMFIKAPEKHCNLITESVFQQLRLSAGDVLVCRTNGNPHLVGKAAVVMEDTDCAYASYVFKIRPNNRITPQLLTVYLNSKYGRSEIERHQMISIQTNFSPERFKKCRIPYFSQPFQTAVSDMVNKAYVNLKNSKSLYTATEQYLLNSLGFNDFVPSDNKISIRGLAASFRSSNRIDAEYYQLKYEDIENVICSNETVFCRINDGVFTPHNQDYKYIELSDIGTSGNIIGCTVAPLDKLPSRARRMVKHNQIIVSSIEGSLSSCAIIPEEYDGALCSTGFYIAEASAINPETLLVLFKSAPIQALMKKWCSGTILTAISKSSLEKIPLPKISTLDQQKIASNVQKSFSLRHQSEQLLDMAKRTVEMAIEGDEDTAMKWLGVFTKGKSGGPKA